MQRHDELPPLNAAQQAETLRLAARLQADHEAQASAEALLRAAAEAGIEERFVREAARQVTRGTERPSRIPSPVAATLVLAVANWLVLWAHPTSAVGVMVETWHIVLLVALAFAGSLWAGRERAARWTLPLAVPAIWVALGVPMAVHLHAIHGYTPSWLAASAVIVGGFQMLAATVGALLSSYEPRARTGRLYRPDQP